MYYSRSLIVQHVVDLQCFQLSKLYGVCRTINDIASIKNTVPYDYLVVTSLTLIIRAFLSYYD